MNSLTSSWKCLIAVLAACAITVAPRTTSAAQTGEAIGLIETKGLIALIEATDALIEAELYLGSRGQTDGFIQITLSTGAVRRLELIFATPLGESSSDDVFSTPLLIIAEDVDANAAIRALNDRVIITRMSDSGEQPVFHWDIVTTSLCDGAGTGRLQFDSPAKLVRLDYEFPDREIGLPVQADLFAPLQTLTLDGSRELLDFGMRVQIDPDNQSQGLIYAPLSERGSWYVPHFGATFVDGQFGSLTIIVAALPNATNVDDLLTVILVPADGDLSDRIEDMLISLSTESHSATSRTRFFTTYRPQFYFRTTDATGR